MLAGLASAADTGLPPATKVFGGAAALALGIAAMLLLLVVRPRLDGADHASFPYWARPGENAIRACMNGDPRAAQVRVLSTIAMAKFARLRWAVDCSLAALVLPALAAGRRLVTAAQWPPPPASLASAPRPPSPASPMRRERRVTPGPGDRDVLEGPDAPDGSPLPTGWQDLRHAG